ncbi:MAG: hypothetical protein ACYCXN_06680 [Acidimicrobiales bacterium]
MPQSYSDPASALASACFASQLDRVVRLADGKVVRHPRRNFPATTC